MSTRRYFLGGIVGGINDMLGIGPKHGTVTPEQSEAMSLAREGMAAWGNVPFSDYEHLIDLAIKQGKITPEMGEQYRAELMQGVDPTQQDPRLRETMMAAMQEEQERGKYGITDLDKLKLDEMRQQMQSDEASRQANITRTLQEQGMSGGGQEVARRMMSGAQASQAANQAYRTNALAALQGRQAAITNAANMANQMSQQDQQRQQFNRQMQYNTQAANVAAKNQAAKMKAARDQVLADKRYGAKTGMYDKLMGIENLKFNEASKVATGKSGAASSAAGTYSGITRGPSEMESALGFGKGVAGMFGAFGAEDGAVIPYANGGVVDNAEIASISDQLRAMREEDPSLIGSKEYQDLLRAKSRMQHDEHLKIPASIPDLGPMQDVLPRTINPNDTREDFRRGAIEKAMDPMTYSEMSRINDVNSQVDARDNNVHYPEEEGSEFSYADREDEERALRRQEALDARYADGGVADWGSVVNRLGDSNPFMQKASAQDQIAQFNAMNTKKYAQGGVPGIIAENGDVVSVDSGFIFPGEEDEYANDRVDAKVNRGEMILNAEQQQRMLDVLRGEQSPEILKNGEDVVETPEAAQNRGFLKVLEMIGKK